MRIDITHFGQDYAKVEIERYKSKKAVEYEVPIDTAKQVRVMLRALERLITSSAYNVHIKR